MCPLPSGMMMSKTSERPSAPHAWPIWSRPRQKGRSQNATKQETGKVVPTWNYIAVHAYGPVEFFQKPERLLEVVTRLTNIHEKSRAKLWAVVDAPADFIASQLRGIVGVRIPVTRFEGKRKMSQNRPVADRSRGRATGETLDRPIRRAPCRRPGCALQASHLRSCPVRPIPLLAPPGLEPAGGLPPPPACTFHWPAGRGAPARLASPQLHQR
jgi:hypothetical protein